MSQQRVAYEVNMKGELTNLDATEQAELVRRKEVSPLELVDAAITRIEKVNPQLNAVITPLFDKARAQEQEGRGSSLPDGPFRGVPFLLKDLVCATGDDPLYEGMRLLRDARFVAPYDTYLAAKFRAAGFICLGKTNTPELGLNGTTEPEAFGPSCNPWNDPIDRRLQRRFRRRGSVAYGGGRSRQRRRRLDPHSGQRMRPGRAEAVARPR